MNFPLPGLGVHRNGPNCRQRDWLTLWVQPRRSLSPVEIGMDISVLLTVKSSLEVIMKLHRGHGVWVLLIRKAEPWRGNTEMKRTVGGGSTSLYLQAVLLICHVSPLCPGYYIDPRCAIQCVVWHVLKWVGEGVRKDQWSKDLIKILIQWHESLSTLNHNIYWLTRKGDHAETVTDFFLCLRNAMLCAQKICCWNLCTCDIFTNNVCCFWLRFVPKSLEVHVITS